MNILAEIREGLGISWAALRANKMRSVLATLGIVIGILTVTLMGAAINGLNQAFIRNISSLGANVFYVSRYKWFNNSYADWLSMRRRPPITLAEAENAARRLTLAQAVAPEADDEDPVKYGNRSADSVEIIGTTEAYLQTSGLDVADGRFLTLPTPKAPSQFASSATTSPRTCFAVSRPSESASALRTNRFKSSACCKSRA